MYVQNYECICIIGVLILFTQKSYEAAPVGRNKTSVLPKQMSDVNPWKQFKQSTKLFTASKKPYRADLGFGLGFAAKNESDAGDAGDANKGKTKGNPRPKELTLSMPRFRKNDKGEWVVAYEGRTMGNVWQDTRFNMHIGQQLTIIPFRLDRSPGNQYYFPDPKTETVCRDQSTIYNIPRVHQYQGRGTYLTLHDSRPIWEDLRRQIYKLGKADECHSPTMLRWVDFMECSVRRNQRLEYLVPKYPLHQVGYRKGLYLS